MTFIYLTKIVKISINSFQIRLLGLGADGPESKQSCMYDLAP